MRFRTAVAGSVDHGFVSFGSSLSVVLALGDDVLHKDKDINQAVKKRKRGGGGRGSIGQGHVDGLRRGVISGKKLQNTWRVAQIQRRH